MKYRLFCVVLLMLLALSGCHKKKEFSLTLKEQASLLASNASWLMKENMYEKAIPMLKKASDFQPLCAEYHVGIAMASVQIEDYATACDRYQRALSILQQQSQDDPERVDDLIMVLICLNRDKEAGEVLNKAKERFKDSPSVLMITENYTDITEEFNQYRIKE